MSIWRTHPSVEQLQEHARDTLAETIGIRVTQIGLTFYVPPCL